LPTKGITRNTIDQKVFREGGDLMIPLLKKKMLVVEPDYLPDSEVLAFSRVYTP
jgi:hypothetical protein